MIRKAFSWFSMTTLAVATVDAPHGAEAAVGGYLVDGEVCSADALVVTYSTGDIASCLTATGDFFDERGYPVTVERLFEDGMLCAPHLAWDPNGLTSIYRISRIADHVEDVQFDLTAELRALDCVDSYPASTPVELDCQVSALAQPEAFADGWNQRFIDMRPPEAAGVTTRIAILDTGVDDSHPALSGRLEMGDATNFAADGSDRDLNDLHGHGTHVAGVVASIVPDARLIPVRVLESDGVGDWSATARGLLHAASRGAEVINLSLGTPTDHPEFFDRAIAEAVGCYDAVVVAAAGRSCDMGASCAEVFSPARHPDVLAVGAVDNFGDTERRATGGEALDLLAPGVHVCSAWPTAATDAGPMDYRRWSGSSVSTAHATAVAALVRHTFPTFDQVDVRDRLIYTAVSPENADCCTGEAGWLNACNALGLHDCLPREHLLGHPVGLTCEGDESPAPYLETVFVAGAAVSPAVHGCSGVDDVYSTHPMPVNPPAYYCPDEKPVPPLNCTARLSSQPPKGGCPDCDVEFALANFAELNLRFKHPDLSIFDGFLLRLQTADGRTYVYPLGIGPFPQGLKRAKVRYQVETTFNAPNLYDVVSAELVSVYQGPMGKQAWVADPLWIR